MQTNEMFKHVKHHMETLLVTSVSQQGCLATQCHPGFTKVVDEYCNNDWTLICQDPQAPGILFLKYDKK